MIHRQPQRRVRDSDLNLECKSMMYTTCQRPNRCNRRGIPISKPINQYSQNQPQPQALYYESAVMYPCFAIS